ncbi:L-threonylcarbamoyladenylate synthase [Alloscardovia macacae]|uniref:L-threonylcarbamoyladenylate synthase n=1 Tax=Alloscardovia macacae TaxID=1160091 RepID=UPI00214DD7A4|nr:L-threonylcarbamoyladenylate synthase [Alloscardovia macacae]
MTEKKYGIQPVTDETLRIAEELIRAGEVVVIPTDTVYGVVADPAKEQAVEKIFQVKHRPHEKTVQILAASMEDTEKFGVRVPDALVPVEKAFMPGAVSVIARVNDQQEQQTERLATVRTEADGSLTQAVRLPDNEVSLRILSALGPLAASSANLSGQEAAANAQDAYAQLGDTVALYLDGGPTPGPVASTVVAWDEDSQQPVFLREGVVPSAKIRAALA